MFVLHAPVCRNVERTIECCCWTNDNDIFFFPFLFSAAPNTNINLEMNYWPALPCNLAECQEPLFDFIFSLSVNGSKTAEVRIIRFLSKF